MMRLRKRPKNDWLEKTNRWAIPFTVSWKYSRDESLSLLSAFEMLLDAEVLHAVLHAIDDFLASQQVAHNGHGYQGADARALEYVDICQFAVGLGECIEYLAAFMLVIIHNDLRFDDLRFSICYDGGSKFFTLHSSLFTYQSSYVSPALTSKVWTLMFGWSR